MPTADSRFAVPCPSDRNALRNPPRQHVPTVIANFENEKYRMLDAEDEAAGEPDLYEMMAKKKGISPYEANLELRIGFLQSLNTYAPNFRCPTRLTNG